MSEILGRLVQLTRAHLQDFLEHRWRRWRAARPWDTNDATSDDPEAADRFSTSSSEAHSGLPYSEELAGYYRDLDLPFGAPMEQVTRRWKTYLKKCHPDRYANDLDKQADATRLTQELTRAYEKIKAAWE
jgi:hypothetical protein